MISESRTRNSIYNASFAALNKGILIVTGFINRTVFIYLMGKEFLGLSSLFTTVLTVLSLSELGISSAVTYHMYEPIQKRDYSKLEEIIQLYRKSYRIIGVVMLVIGFMLLPILPYIVNFDADTGINIYVVYLLTLLRSVISYLCYGYAQSVIEANQKQRVISNYTSISNVITMIVVTTTLYITHNYYLYLIILIVVEVVKNVFLYVYSRKNYEYINPDRTVKVSVKLRKSVFKDVFSVFVFKITATIGQSVDNIVISIFLGTVIVGYYGNYTMLVAYIITTITLIINSFGGSIGNLNASGDRRQLKNVFYQIDLVTFWLMAVSSVCLVQLLNPFIVFWLKDSSYVLSEEVVYLVCANNYINSSLNAIYIFRNSLGLFKYGKYNFLICGISNLILSVILCMYLGIEGVLIATFISYLVISTLPFPYYLFKYGFGESSKPYILEMFARYVMMVGMCFICKKLCTPFMYNYSFWSLVVQGIICVVTVSIILFVIYGRTEKFRILVRRVKQLRKTC